MYLTADVVGLLRAWRVDLPIEIEKQRTERARIRAQRDVLVAAIQAQERLLREYMDRTFGERSEVLERFFTMLDSALAAGKLDQMETALAGILGVVRTNPFLGFEAFRAARLDPGFTIEF